MASELLKQLVRSKIEELEARSFWMVMDQTRAPEHPDGLASLIKPDGAG